MHIYCKMSFAKRHHATIGTVGTVGTPADAKAHGLQPPGGVAKSKTPHGIIGHRSSGLQQMSKEL